MVEITLSLPEEVIDLIMKKAEYTHMQPWEVVTWMIMDFSPSTEDERKEQLDNMVRERNFCLKEYPNADPVDIWTHGYLKGWELYQRRKKNSPFRLISEEKDV
jgi:hypothetical protein